MSLRAAGMEAPASRRPGRPVVQFPRFGKSDRTSPRRGGAGRASRLPHPDRQGTGGCRSVSPDCLVREQTRQHARHQRTDRSGTAMTMSPTYSELPNKLVNAPNGIDYAHRDAGDGQVPLVLLQHFRGNLDNWDPALVDALATTRRVVTFDNAGVGGSSGSTPDTIEQMAREAIVFITALDVAEVDLLGFSIGSFVAQEIALTRPALVRRLVLASSAPRGAAGMHGWAAEVIGAIGTPQTSPEAYLGVFFTPSAPSRQAGQEALRRIYARTQDRDKATTWATREAQHDAV